MKLLLLGKDGQVGQALQTTLPAVGEVVALGRAEADLEQPGELPRIVAAEAPDIIVNAAAYTAVDRAESDAERARLVNAEAVATLAVAAKRAGAWLVHYSTDYVFDGRKPEPYVESDEPNPLSVYGATKRKGDQAIAEAGCRHLIFRVSWVYARGRGNFPATMLRLARERTTLAVVADQIGGPTSAERIAAVTAAAIRQLDRGDTAAAETLAGTYHLAPDGFASRDEYARFIIGEALACGAPLLLRPEAVTPIATADVGSAARRPLNSRLDTHKLKATFGIDLPPWQDDARQWVAHTVREGRF